MAITNLKGKIAYDATLSDLPICVLMHGWSEGITAIQSLDMARIAKLGLFVVAVGMRGFDGAGGASDASGREIYDIYDAVEYVRANYAAYVSQTKAAIVGYSGGGGNALAAACKFPDYWNVVVSHFGMSDYGRNNPDGWYYNNGGAYTAGIVTRIGDTPTNVPNNYYARDATVAIANYSGGYLFLYHDKQDATVPWVHGNRIKSVMDTAGLTNYSANFSDTGEIPRYTHGYPTANASLLYVESIWSAKILSQAAWTIEEAATKTVIANMKTKRFEIDVNQTGSPAWSQDAAATVVYNTATDTYTVTPLTGAIDVSITQGAKTGSATNISAETEIVVS